MQWSSSVGRRALVSVAIVVVVTLIHPIPHAAAESEPQCLRGPTDLGFSVVSYEGGSVVELETCAFRSGVRAVYARSDDRYVSLITGAPEIVNRAFHDLYPGGVPAGTSLIASRNGTASPDPDPPLTECSATAATARVSGSVAVIHAGDNRGTAFYIGNFRWLTAKHVVTDETTVRLRNADLDVTAEVVGSDTDADLAVLRGPSNARALSWGEPPLYAADALVLGYGQGQRTLAAGVTRGVVSERFTEDGLHYIRTDAPANPGNSGGPLIDICGNVIGIVQRKIADLTVEGVALALATESVRVSPVLAR